MRELENIVGRATVLCRDGVIRPEHLPAELSSVGRTIADRPLPPEEILALRKAVRSFEREYIRRVLAAAGGSRSRACALLEIGRKALWERMKKED